MKKIILFFLLISLSSAINAQTDGDDSKNKIPPTFTNPFGNNPYGTNPYNNIKNGNKNIFENIQNIQNENKKTLNESDDKKDGNKDNKKKLDLTDRNTKKGDSYKKDPDYQKYIYILEPDKKEENEKEVSFNTEDPRGAVYGSNFLTANSSPTSSKLTTVPEDYKLGIGDEVIVSVWGASEFQSPFTISKDGSIFPNNVGKIFLQGLSFESARSLIQSKFKRVLPPGSQVDIVMGKIRTIRVYLFGEVNNAGMITISALNTPLNALQIAGGINKFGNMRDIKIRRNGIIIERLDLYEYLQNGGNGREFYMEDNDVITVGLYDKIVQAKGSFKRPMRYQMPRNGTLSELMELAGGLTYNARGSHIRVKTIRNEKEKYQEFSSNDLLNIDFVLNDGDVVTINSINSGVTNIVNITGSIAYPDRYQINNGDRIFDIIRKAGGLNSDAFKSRAYVYRNGKTSDDAEAIKIDVSDFKNHQSKNNILLENGDHIKILSESRFDENFFVSVKGLVRDGGPIPYKPNLRLKDVLIMAGGLELEAESGRIEISNITDSVNRFSIYGKKTNIISVGINPDLSIDSASEQILIKPYDIIFIRKKKEIFTQKLIYIAGEVDYPGPYALLNNNETLTSIIERTGGLTNDAYPSAAKLYRLNYGPVVIDLKKALNNKLGTEDIILEEGDQIIIPRKDQIVKVIGNVQMPINIKYNSNESTVMNYVDAAGGFGDRPWRKRISVRYQNGKLKRTKNFLFFKFYPKVRSGAVVNVPIRPKHNFNFNALGTLRTGIATATSLLTLVLLINNIR